MNRLIRDGNKQNMDVVRKCRSGEAVPVDPCSTSESQKTPLELLLSSGSNLTADASGDQTGHRIRSTGFSGALGASKFSFGLIIME